MQQKYKAKVERSSSLSNIYVTNVDIWKTVPNTHYVFKRGEIYYDSETKSFCYVDFISSIPIPNIVNMTEEEEFQYSLVYEDIWGIEWDYYRMKSFQESLISCIDKQPYTLINLEY